MIAGFFVGQALNMSFYDSLFMAVALSVSSTVVIMKVLEELKILREEASYLTLGILIIEDIIILSIFALLHSTSVTGNISIVEILIPIGITIAFIAGVLIIGSRTIPRLVDFVARTNQSDVLVVAGTWSSLWLCICFKLAWDFSSGWGLFCRSINSSNQNLMLLQAS